MPELNPTYTANEVLAHVRIFSLEDCKLLMDEVQEEIDRYSVSDYIILVQAAMVMLGRSVLLVGK